MCYYCTETFALSSTLCIVYFKLYIYRKQSYNCKSTDFTVLKKDIVESIIICTKAPNQLLRMHAVYRYSPS